MSKRLQRFRQLLQVSSRFRRNWSLFGLERGKSRDFCSRSLVNVGNIVCKSCIDRFIEMPYCLRTVIARLLMESMEGTGFGENKQD